MQQFRKYALYFLPIVLAYTCWLTFPFSDEIASKTISLSSLSPQQKANIQLAASTINGKVLKPGTTFSFNQIVGPRISNRGYLLAPSYLEKESQKSLGGGICLLSSAVYQLALTTNCQILERVAHQRTIRSVPPGLDATVWYGRSDLRFINSYNGPIEIVTNYSPDAIKISFMSKSTKNKSPVQLEPVVVRRTKDFILVDLIAKTSTKSTLLTHDLYRLN